MDTRWTQKADLIWRDGNQPVSRQFDDPYFSDADGLKESRHVFLHGNNLPLRFHEGFHIAELGFGTGLNALATAQAWEHAGFGGPLQFTSFEAFPMKAADLQRAICNWPELEKWAEPLAYQWRNGTREIELPGMRLHVIEGDARQTLATWPGAADAWFLDGFSPARNPEMWEEKLLAEVGRHTNPGGTCATYSAAGAIRHRLADAGFEVERITGFGTKRHMTRGRMAI